MNIVFLSDAIPPRSIGGAAESIWRVARCLHALGHHIVVITTVQSKQYEGTEDRNGITVYSIYSQYHARWRAYLSIYNPQTVPQVKPR